MARPANAALIGAPDARARLATPCLLLEADAFEHNVGAMMALVRRYGRAAPPARQGAQVHDDRQAPARGRCHRPLLRHRARGRGHGGGRPSGHPGHLAGRRHPRWSSGSLRAHAAVGDLAVVVDSDHGVDALAAAASAAQPLGVLVEIDVGQGRTGVTRPEDALRLARRIADLPQLRYQGVQAYYGHLQHVPAYADRKAKAAEQWARLQPFLDALRADGLAPGIVTGGGTGTHQLDLEDGPFTEIQPGSYLFMDKQYGAIELAPGGVAVRGGALGRGARGQRQPAGPRRDRRRLQGHGDRCRPGPVAERRGPRSYQFMGDEHGGLRYGEGAPRAGVNELVRLVAPHCDPTVNLHDHFHVMQGDRLVEIWPIDARGYEPLGAP